MEESNLVLLEQKFGLSNLDIELKNKFYSAIKDYLNHGRSYEFLIKQIETFMQFCDIVNITMNEKIIILSKFPGILNSIDDLYNKYLFLGIIESPDNSFRRNKLINKPNDFRVGFKKMYSRYKFMIEVGYDSISWNTLLHATDEEFASIFVVGKYSKPYRIFNSVNEVLDTLNNIPLDDFNIDDYKKLDVNKEIVEKYENKDCRRGNAKL